MKYTYQKLTVAVFLALFTTQSFAAVIESSDIENDGTWTTGSNSLPYLGAIAGITPTAGSVTFHMNNDSIGPNGIHSVTFLSLLEIGSYKATIDVGNYNNAPFLTIGNIGMTAGGNLLTPVSSLTTTPALGSILTWTFDYSIMAGNPFLGQNIGFEISAPQSATSGNASFDNLQIDFQVASAIPVPATFSLMGLGLAGLCFSRKLKA